MAEINRVLAIVPSWAGLSRQRAADASGMAMQPAAGEWWFGRGAGHSPGGSAARGGLPAAGSSWGPVGEFRKAGKDTTGGTLGV